MRVLLENKAIGRSVEMELSDTFMKNPEDIRLIAGSECFALVSTKSEVDKKRETLGIEFANEYFTEIQKLKPKDDEELINLLKERLATDKYKELLSISDEQMLITTLVTSYRRYDAISSKLIDLEQEIKNTTIDQNVFFDYIERLKNIIVNAKTLKDFHDGILKLKEMSHCDERIAVGIPTIFECATSLIEEEQLLINEVREANKGKNIKDLPIFTDADFWTQRFASKAEESTKKLYGLYVFWRNYQKQLNSNPKDDKKFAFMLNNIIDTTKPLAELSIKLHELVSKDNDAVAIEKIRESISEAICKYHAKMRELEIIECLDSRKYNTVEEATFIDTNFAEYRAIENGVAECACTGEKYSWRDYLMKLVLNYQICCAIKAGKVDLKKLLDGTYTEDELRELMNNADPEVK